MASNMDMAHDNIHIHGILELGGAKREYLVSGHQHLHGKQG